MYIECALPIEVLEQDVADLNLSIKSKCSSTKRNFVNDESETKLVTDTEAEGTKKKFIKISEWGEGKSWQSADERRVSGLNSLLELFIWTNFHLYANRDARKFSQFSCYFDLLRDGEKANFVSGLIERWKFADERGDESKSEIYASREEFNKNSKLTLFRVRRHPALAYEMIWK